MYYVQAVHWLAAGKLKKDLADLNSDNTPCPANLLHGIRALVTTLRSWLITGLNSDNTPCPADLLQTLISPVW
jgi:hypothetical protein